MHRLRADNAATARPRSKETLIRAFCRAFQTTPRAFVNNVVSRLDEINALAERTKGFVWRLKSEAGDASSIRVFDDPQVLINMSVWETLDDLKRFVYRTAHLELLRNREAWFKRLSQQHQAAWWIPAGEFPSPEQGRDRLLHLRKHGPTAIAFTLAKPFPPPQE